MQMISSRAVPFIDAQSLTSGEHASVTQERVMLLDLREALIWLNESAQEQGSFWE
jgi:hypothetical protein